MNISRMVFREGDNSIIRVRLIREGEGDIVDADVQGMIVKLEFVDGNGNVIRTVTGTYSQTGGYWEFKVLVDVALAEAVRAYVVIESVDGTYRESSRPINVVVQK